MNADNVILLILGDEMLCRRNHQLSMIVPEYSKKMY